MREFKFRGQGENNNDWIFGYLIKDYTGDVLISSLDGMEATEVYPKTVGQYTGLKDKNGVEIYEGDILDSSEKIPMIFEVYFEDGGFKYGTKDRSVDIGFSGHTWLKNILSRFHVIGNIHSNPELLK